MNFSEQNMGIPELNGAIQVVGFGVAGLGVAFAADNQHCLEKFCDSGLIFLDKREKNQFNSLDFDILSNSPAADFTGAIRKDGAFSRVLNNSTGKKLSCLADKETPLTLVSEFFSDSAAHLHALIDHYPRSTFLSSTNVDALRLERNGTITSLNERGQSLVTSQFVILATGSVEKRRPSIINYAHSVDSQLELSESVLRGLNDQAIRSCLEASKNIVIVGGSHSAFSVVDYLLRNFGHTIQPKQITIISRSPIKIYHSNLKEFHNCSQENEECLIDFETQNVNRYCGLRSNAKNLYFQILSGSEKRVNLVYSPTLEHPPLNKQRIGAPGLVIQATGYQSHTPRIINEQNQSIDVEQMHGCDSLSKQYSLRSSSHRTLNNVFRLGLGSLIPSMAPYATTGEVPVGVNIYHQKDASAIVALINQQLQQGVNPTATPYFELRDLC